MKKLIAALLVSALVTGCASTRKIDNVEYDTYGVFSAGEKRNPDVHYEVCWGNVIWGVLLFETIIAPIYFFGFSLYEPRGKESGVRGAVTP